MKRLMLLGGNRYQLPVIRAAHDLGYYVITCDNLPDNVAHKFSDEYCNVSIIEKELVLTAAIDKRIDGIMSFGCDPGVVPAAYVAEKLQLPSVGSYDAVSVLQNKGAFRNFLKENGFNVPNAKTYKQQKDALDDISLFNWPVIVKPTDSAGSKGVSKVEKKKDLELAIQHALENSISKEFIIEDYLEKVGCSSDTDIFSIDGEIRFMSFNAQRFDVNSANPYTPAAYSWPSTMTKEHELELASEIQRVINLLDLKTSIYNVETREAIDGKAYIMELSPRGGGNRLAEVLNYATGVDMIKAAVLASVGEEINHIEQKPYNSNWAEVILHSNTVGAFQNLWVSEDIVDNIVEKDLWVKHGELVNSFGAANNAIGTLIMRFDDESMMLDVINNVNDYVRVITK